MLTKLDETFYFISVKLANWPHCWMSTRRL